MTTFQRWFDASRAFDHPITLLGTLVVASVLLLASLALHLLHRNQRLSAATYQELRQRIRSWYLLSGVLLGPILLGAFWVIGFFGLLSLFCFREYARATKLDQSKLAMFSVGTAIFITYFAVLDHWRGLFTTSWTLGICGIAVIALVADRPQGYIQRISLSIIGFALFGISLSHLAFIANDVLFRPILLSLLLSVSLNDVFAYLSGKTLGKRKLLPHTSPNKTWGGAIGAVLLTTTLVAVLSHFVFRGTSLDHWLHGINLGLIVSVLGQCGDLVVSSIKRDLGVKDMASVIPGHGGLLDRFDSLLIVAPVYFHYLNYFLEFGIGGNQPTQIITGR